MMILLCAGAVWSDLRWQKIENGYLAVFLLLGIPTRLLFVGADHGAAVSAGGVKGAFLPVQLSDAMTGLLLPILLLGLFWLLRMIGAGDVKLLSVLGWYMGKEILVCLWWTLLLAAMLSILILTDEGITAERWRYLKQYAGDCLKSGKRIPYRQPGFHRESLHMAVPVFLSVLLYAAGVYGK